MTTTTNEIKALLASHREESDAAAKPLANALREAGEIVAEKGTPNQDYTGLIKFDGETWLVEQNNAWTRVYDPADASYDYRAELGID